MQTRYKKIMAFAALVALTAVSTLALAQETSSRVGRVSLTQGQVSMASDVGEEMVPAVLNWPVTTRNQISTGRGGRSEVRIGSTAIRLDGDTALEVSELDDDTLSLHLHYGSVSVRIRNPDVARGFVLTTPHGQVRVQEAGRLRVDVDRLPDTSIVNVFDGVALVDGGGSTLTLRANRRAEMHQDGLRTMMATRDGFDDWALLRDARDERLVAERYTGSEMTGYEDLDQHGAWTEDREYGPLWAPRHVSSGWVPYRDGRWTWVAPWGWTWVDNAPWGYAPFHYGRWVVVNNRWYWAPGRDIGRPVWAPALVGWVGGSNWQLSFGTRHQAPATGWYPLGPRHTYVPGYRMPDQHLRHINRHARADHHDGRGRDGRGRWDNDQRPNMVGLTVVPHAQFGQRGTVEVRNAPRAVVPPLVMQTAPSTAAPAPGPRAGFGDRPRDGRADNPGRGNRNDRGDNHDRGNRNDRGDNHDRGNRNDRDERVSRPGPLVAPVAPAVQQPQVVAPVHQPARPSPRNDYRGDDDPVRRGGRAQAAPAPVVQQQHQFVRPVPAPQQPQFQAPAPAPQQQFTRPAAPPVAPPPAAAPSTEVKPPNNPGHPNRDRRGNDKVGREAER
jgi:hypothetical protein